MIMKGTARIALVILGVMFIVAGFWQASRFLGFTVQIHPDSSIIFINGQIATIMLLMYLIVGTFAAGLSVILGAWLINEAFKF